MDGHVTLTLYTGREWQDTTQKESEQVCPSTVLDEHRYDHDDNNDGSYSESMEAQNT